MSSAGDLKRFSDAGNAVFPAPGSEITAFFPETEADLSARLRAAAEGNIPVTVAAALTGLTGGAVPRESGWLLDTTCFLSLPDRPGYRRVAPFLLLAESDPHHGLVAPGVPLQRLNETLREPDLWYPPHPGETRALIGGNVATNASGPRTFAFGSTRDYVESLRVVLVGGEVLDLRRGRERVTAGRFSLRTESGRLLEGRVPEYVMPRVKNAAGLFAAPDMDAIDLFVGSEGILGVFSEIGLRFLPHRDIRAEIFFFPSDAAALDFTDRLRSLKADASRYPAPNAEGSLGILALEYFDENSLTLAREQGHLVPAAARAAVEVQSFTQDFLVLETVSDLARTLESVGSVPPEDAAALRYSVPRRVAELLKQRGQPKFGTDFAVPVEAFRAMFALYRQKSREFSGARRGVHTAMWGHIGDGHLHLNFLCESEADQTKAKTIYLELVRAAVRLGGSVSAEHGVGKKSLTDEEGVSRPYLWYQYGERYREIAETKKVFDPRGLLNRGNMDI